MKNREAWKETVVKYQDGKITANEQYISHNSFLVVQRTVGSYEKIISEHVTGILLDLGCGTVPYYKVYEEIVEEIICIDWENSHHKNIHLDYTADLNKGIPLGDSSVDTILLTDVLEHISKPHILMKEISRVLSANGKLILGVPFMYWLHEDPFDFHRYTKYRLKELCDENNLRVLCLEELGGPLTIIGDIIAKNIPSTFFAKIFQKTMLLFLKTGIGEKIENKNKEKFPISYRLVAQKK